jgi:hypothetical protein
MIQLTNKLLRQVDCYAVHLLRRVPVNSVGRDRHGLLGDLRFCIAPALVGKIKGRIAAKWLPRLCNCLPAVAATTANDIGNLQCLRASLNRARKTLDRMRMSGKKASGQIRACLQASSISASIVVLPLWPPLLYGGWCVAKKSAFRVPLSRVTLSAFSVLMSHCFCFWPGLGPEMNPGFSAQFE